jgi:DNA-binding NarL/FixJ family response regulator
MTPQRVLVVDDERFFREAIRDALAEEGVDCALAESGEEALKLAEDPRLCAAILDVRLPGMSGIEVLQRLREQRPALRAIVLSAHTDQERVLEALRLGACDYLAKPLHEEELRLSVRRALDGYAVESRWQSVRGRLHLLGARLADLVERAAGTPDGDRLDALAGPATEAVAEVLSAARSSLLRLSGRTLRVAAVTGVDVAPELMEPADVDRSVGGLAVSAGHAILIEDVETDERSAGLARPGRYRTASAALAPLVVDGEIRAVLCATDRVGESRFEDEDLALLRILALQLGSLLRAPAVLAPATPMAEAPAEAPDAAADLARAVCEAMTSEIEPDRLVVAALRPVARALSASPVSLYLIDNMSGSLALQGQVDDGGAADRPSLPRERGLTGMVLQTGRLVATAEPGADARFDPEVDTPEGGGMRPLLCVPLRVRDKVIGVARAFPADGSGASAATGEVLVSALSAAARNVLLYRSLLESIDDVARARREAGR